MPKYRKMPVTVDAVQWTGDNLEEIADLCGDVVQQHRKDPSCLLVLDVTTGAQIPAPKTYWIIKGIRGECYPCDPEIFTITYEPSDDTVDLQAEPGE